MTFRQFRMLARKVDSDAPPPGVKRFRSVAQLRAEYQAGRERQAADPWGVGSPDANGYHA